MCCSPCGGKCLRQCAWITTYSNENALWLQSDLYFLWGAFVIQFWNKWFCLYVVKYGICINNEASQAQFMCWAFSIRWNRWKQADELVKIFENLSFKVVFMDIRHNQLSNKCEYPVSPKSTIINHLTSRKNEKEKSYWLISFGS